MRILISGAGIAGTTLAYWLLKAGHDPVLIEKAPELRTGGYVVDFWGLGFEVAARMGLQEAIFAAGQQQGEVRLVDRTGRKVGGFSMESMADLAGRYTTIRRGALVELIYGAIEGRVETFFGDSIGAIEPRADGVGVRLASGRALDGDLVIGADGLHSRVRALCFGPESRFEHYTGYAVAAFELKGYRPRDEGVYVIHPTPSHQLARIALRDDRSLFLFVFTCPPEAAGDDLPVAEVRRLLRQEFAGVGWEATDILAAMDDVEDIYFDRMSQIRLPSWHRGRVALIGDAAAAVSLLAGEGTGLAMIEAYVLAGELHRAGSDPATAFTAYEQRLRGFVEGKQKTAEQFGSSMVPETEFGVWLRNQATKLMNIPGVAGLLLGRSLRDDFDLPDYSI